MNKWGSIKGLFKYKWDLGILVGQFKYQYFCFLSQIDQLFFCIFAKKYCFLKEILTFFYLQFPSKKKVLFFKRAIWWNLGTKFNFKFNSCFVEICYVVKDLKFAVPNPYFLVYRGFGIYSGHNYFFHILFTIVNVHDTRYIKLEK